MNPTQYSNGQTGVDINPDGTGFLYYPNGGVAVAVSTATDYQNSFYAFDKNRRGTILMGFDEFGCGFGSSSTRRSTGIDSKTIVLSKTGCIVSEEGRISHEWLWDRKAMNCGVEPSGNVLVVLNEHLSLTAKDCKHLTLDFNCDGITYSIDMGAKERRTDNYLDHCTRQPGGHLIPQIDHQSLKERQRLFNESMKGQRNKLHPKSENLSEMVRGIVSRLEMNFEDVAARMKTTPGLGTTWRDDALSNTLSEIPRIPMAGTETGVIPGFGTHIYAPAGTIDFSRTLPARLVDATGKWKNQMEVRSALREMNPPLARSGILKANSGRYSTALVVDKAAVTADNPTGMVTPSGLPLKTILWRNFKEEIATTVPNASAPLVVILLLRGGEAKSIVFEKCCEVAHLMIDNELNSSKKSEADLSKTSLGFSVDKMSTTGLRLLRMDIGDNNEIVSELGIKDVPTFLFFKGPNLVYAGPVGGRRVKLSHTTKPQILIIEPDFKIQVQCEKTLRKNGCDTFLCLNVGEAMSRIQQFSGIGEDRPSIVFDLVLISESINSIDVTILAQRLAEHVGKQRTIIAGLVSVLGPRGKHNLEAVAWQGGYSDETKTLLEPPLSNTVQAIIQKPIKPASIEKLLAMLLVPREETNFGLTPETLLMKVKQIHSDFLGKTGPVVGAAAGGGSSFGSTLGDAGNGAAGQYVGIRLSAEDVRMRGKSLTR